MAKMKVGKVGLSLIPEGVHVFKVVGCVDKYEKFDKVSYKLQVASGQKITINFNFVDSKGEVNEIATYYWSKFARACLNLGANEEPEIDFSDLIGCYVEFNFVDSKGEVNEIATYYWSKFARACLNLGANEEPEIDFSDLIGCYVEAEVKHNTYIAKSGNHAGEEMTGANILDKSYAPASGFPGSNTAPKSPVDDTEEDEDLDDLDDLE